MLYAMQSLKPLLNEYFVMYHIQIKDQCCVPDIFTETNCKVTVLVCKPLL